MEFIIPVKFSGTRSYHVTKSSLEEAVKDARDKADVTAKYELCMADTTIDICAPLLMLDETQLNAWPYWCYGYHGTDGVDWRSYYTDKGRQAIPDIAESSYPVPEVWIKGVEKKPDPEIEASVRNLMKDNEENLGDMANTYAKGYQDALLDVLSAMGVAVPKERFN